jgi:hypothetical protein
MEIQHGIDQVLPGGLIATLEGIYTKDINAVYHQNVVLPNSTVNAAGADNRPIYYNTNANGIPTSVNTTLYPRIPQIRVVTQQLILISPMPFL